MIAQLAFAITLPRCVVADVALVSNLDSRHVVSGDSFTFKTLARVAAAESLPTIPAGTLGFGVIAYARHAGANGQAGRIVLEPRFLRLADGVHVPATADPHLDDQFVEGSTRNAPSIDFVPVIGIAVGAYNALHRGKEIAIRPGTPLRVVLGDDLALKRCSDPPASDY